LESAFSDGPSQIGIQLMRLARGTEGFNCFLFQRGQHSACPAAKKAAERFKIFE